MPRKSSRRSDYSTLAGLTRSTFRLIDTIGNHVFTSMTKDLHGTSWHLMNMPKMPFWDSFWYIVVTFVSGIVGALVAGGLWFLKTAYGLPAYLHLMLSH